MSTLRRHTFSERISRSRVRHSVRTLRWVTVTLVLLVPGCRWPWESEVGSITGTVRYPEGARANVAFVYAYGQPRTYTDWNGQYRLVVQGSVNDTVTVVAYDFCRGGCTATSYGFTKVVLRRSPMVVDIVMDQAEAI